MSRILKGRQIVIDDQTYVVTPKAPLPAQEETVPEPSGPSPEELKERRQKEADAIIQNALAEAKKTIDEAEAEKQRILEEAGVEAERIRDQARESGYAEGLDRGYTEGWQESRQIVEEARRLKDETIETYRDYLDKAESDLIRLTIDTIETILKQAVEDPSAIEGLLRDGVQRLSHIETMRVLVAPRDLDYARALEAELVVLTEKVGRVLIDEDPRLAPGSVVVESDAGSVDLSIGKQFKRIEDALKGRLGE